MHIALLLTNTDDSAFSGRHPLDDARFTSLIHLVRPDWQVTAFWVRKGQFPPEGARFDGWLIGGSPASVHDTDAWIATLFDLIRRIHADQTPLFGACFGHQAVAQALGGQVGPNPGGWVFGATDTSLEGAPIRLYAAHSEQVVRLPHDATALGGNDACPIGSFAIGDHVLTSQYHPEITQDFMQALVAEYALKLPADVAAAARASLARPAETARMAERLACFYEASR